MINLNKDITAIVATSGVFVATLSDVDGAQESMKVDIGGLPTAAWNVMGATITAVNTTTKTITYSHGNFTFTSQTITTGVAHIEVNWVDVAYVETLIGYTTSGDDLTYLETCVDAANDWAFIRRQKSGYVDHPNIAGGSNVRLGTGLYALALFREKGSVDSFATFTDTPLVGQMAGSMGQIRKLLGIDRAQVA